MRAAIILITGFHTFAGFANAAPSIECSPVHIIVARASTEPKGMGVIGSLAGLVQKSVPGTTAEAVDYPAKLYPYADSSSKGTVALKAQLSSYIRACPESKILLMGYSQGAHIIGDALCGGGGVNAIGPTTKAMEQETNPHIVAIVQMGDPRFIVDQSYDVGSAKKGGLFKRLSSQSCSAYADRIRSYCDAGDSFCDSGTNTMVHLGYTRKYNEVALWFILSKLKA